MTAVRRFAALLTLGLLPGALLAAVPAQAAVPPAIPPAIPAAIPSAVPSAAPSVAPSAVAEGVVVGAELPGAVPGRYLVTGADGDTEVATMDARAARRLAADPRVRAVEQDRLVRTEATQRNPVWNLDRLDQRTITPSRTFDPAGDGRGVRAYVIDTGVRITHKQFGGRASYGYDFADDDRNATDCNGHGTHVAGTLGGSTYGVAKKVRIVAVRVLDCQGRGYVSDIIAGVEWVTAHAVRPAVANMSLGADERSPALNAAVQRSIRKGITYVVAAGNANRDAAKVSPANVPAAVTVGAADSRDRRAAFSNWGSTVDIFAPGVGVRSAWKTGNTATAALTGTSMATPHVAGAAALMLGAHPAWTPALVRASLVSRATTGRIAGRRGAPDRLLYVPRPVVRP